VEADRPIKARMKKKDPISKRILHIITSPRAEGTPRLVLSWMRENYCEHEVYALSSTPSDLTQELIDAAQWFKAERALPPGKIKFFWMVANVRRVCLERQPDMVICWPNGFGPWILFGARLAGVRRLASYGGNPPNWTLMGCFFAFYSTAALKIVGGRMICCSRYVESKFARSPGVFRSVLCTVMNCVSIDLVQARAREARALRCSGRPKLLMVATLEKHKDHETLLRALVRVRHAVPDVELILAGEGTLRPRLEGLVSELKLTPNVIFLGACNDVPRQLGQSDVFVFSTTEQEGQGIVLLEALAAGLPIVASDVAACRETLEGGRWGRLVPPANPEELARALVEVLQNPQTRGAKADLSNYLERFRPTKMIESYIAATSQ
jgi:glycosyltransferase involved in cell wall biosynthesis